MKASRSNLAGLAGLAALHTISIWGYIWAHLRAHLAAAHRVLNAYLVTHNRDSRHRTL